MATQVFRQETFQLQDEFGDPGREVKITPLPIKWLREFMEEFNKLQEVKEDSEATEVMYKCAVIAIKARNREVTEEELENTLDIATAMQIVQVAGGIDLDPNLTGQPQKE